MPNHRSSLQAPGHRGAALDAAPIAIEARAMNKKEASPDSRQLGLDRRTSYRFSIIARRQTRCLAEMHSAACGLSVNGWKLLSVVEYFGPLSASEAGAHTSLEPAKVTRGIDSLVDQGLVLRRADPSDRRRIILSLSARGKRIHAKVEQVSRALERELLSVLTSEELETLYRALDKLERRSSEVFTGNSAWRQIVGASPARRKHSIRQRLRPRTG
jgi:DNA-binding MarR family transcriptional regulator